MRQNQKSVIKLSEVNNLSKHPIHIFLICNSIVKYKIENKNYNKFPLFMIQSSLAKNICNDALLIRSSLIVDKNN